jgi:HK97 gp10 family phage protein
MDDVSIKVNGLGELKQRLEELNDGKLARSMMRSGARKAAKVLEAGQKEAVPVAQGDLRDSIGVQVTGARTDELHVLIGPDKRLNFIGRFHEFGTKFMAGIHWMQRAWDSTSSAALDAYIAEVKRRLDVKRYADLRRAIEEALSENIEE